MTAARSHARRPGSPGAVRLLSAAACLYRGTREQAEAWAAGPGRAALGDRLRVTRSAHTGCYVIRPVDPSSLTP